VVAARGGTHTRGAAKADWLKDTPASLCQQLFGIPAIGDPLAYEHQENLVFFFEKLQALTNSLGMCYFTHGLSLANMLLPEDFARLYSAAVGRHLDSEKIMWHGERIFNLEKCFNVLHTTWTREDDMPPERFTSTPLGGEFKIDLEEWNSMLDRYYGLHGWDKKTGKPQEHTMKRLNLGTIQEKLEQHLKL
jgi:aldehyde:ferredoxin oxidoreductase